MKTIKLTIILFLIATISSCNNSHQIEKRYINKVDTIFGGDTYPTDKKTPVKLDNGKNSENLICCKTSVAQEFEGIVYYSYYSDVPDSFYTKQQWEDITPNDKKLFIPFYFSKNRLKFEKIFTYIYKDGLLFMCSTPPLNMDCDSTSYMRTKESNAKVMPAKDTILNYPCIHIQTKIPDDYGSYQIDDYWYSPSHYIVSSERYAIYKQTSLGFFYDIGKNIPLRMHLASGQIKLQAVYIEEKPLPDLIFSTK